MKVLFLSRWYPFPANNGSRMRISNLIAHLASRHDVDLLSFASEPTSAEQVAAMRHYCQHVETVLYRPYRPHRWGALLGAFSRYPRSVVDTDSPEMRRLVTQFEQKYAYDAVIASEIDMAPYALAMDACPKVLEDIELGVLHDRYAAERHPVRRARHGLTWWKLKHYVDDLLHAFDGCTVVSAQEQELVRRVSPGSCLVEVVPNGVDTAQYEGDYGPPEADTLVYAGALTYSANFDAVDYFMREIYPLIQAKRPDVRLFVTGGLDGVSTDRLPANEGVVFTGYLEDIRPRIAQSWASIVPLREGGGTRLKVLESLALGTPVVSTSKGSEGLKILSGKEALIADEPRAFAEAVLRLLEDRGLRSELVANGKRLVHEHYDWEQIGGKLDQLLRDVVERRRALR